MPLPSQALNLCTKALKSHNIRPQQSYQVVNERWGCSYNPKGKTEVLKEAISPLHDTASQWPSQVQTATIPTLWHCSKCGGGVLLHLQERWADIWQTSFICEISQMGSSWLLRRIWQWAPVAGVSFCTSRDFTARRGLWYTFLFTLKINNLFAPWSNCTQQNPEVPTAASPSLFTATSS